MNVWVMNGLLSRVWGESFVNPQRVSATIHCIGSRAIHGCQLAGVRSVTMGAERFPCQRRNGRVLEKRRQEAKGLSREQASK